MPRFQVSRNLYASLSEARNQLIQSHALDGDPLFVRLWHCHVVWLWRFIAASTSVESKGLFNACRRRYYRLLDRLFGGYREYEFCQRMLKKAEECQTKAREIQARLNRSQESRDKLSAAMEKKLKDLELEQSALECGTNISPDPSTYN